MTLGEHTQFLPHAQLQSPESGCVTLTLTITLTLTLTLRLVGCVGYSKVMPLSYDNPTQINKQAYDQDTEE